MITRYFSFFDAGIEDVCRSIIDIKEPSYPVSANKSPLKIDLSCVDYGALVTKMVLWTPQKNRLPCMAIREMVFIHYAMF